MKFLVVLLLFSTIGLGQNSDQLTISVKELPPEPFPVGTCKESYSGYLEVSDQGKPKNTNLSSQEIGDYVKKRLSEGYSLSLYPQVSGRLFIIETCQPKKD